MKKLASFGVAVLIALFSALGLAPSAQAYPEPQFNLTVNHQVIYGGQQFTATATSEVTCDWTLEWNGDSRFKTASTFVTTYTAPVVTTITKIPLNATCVYAAASARKSARAAADATWTRSVTITVLPNGSAVSPPSSGGNLPNAGGPRLWIMLAGFGSLLAGAAVVVTARRREDSL